MIIFKNLRCLFEAEEGKMLPWLPPLADFLVMSSQGVWCLSPDCLFGVICGSLDLFTYLLVAVPVLCVALLHSLQLPSDFWTELGVEELGFTLHSIPCDTQP